MNFPSCSCHMRVAQAQVYSHFLLQTQRTHLDCLPVLNIQMLLSPLLAGMPAISLEITFCGGVRYKIGRGCWEKCQRGDLGPQRLKQPAKQAALMPIQAGLDAEMTEML